MDDADVRGLHSGRGTIQRMDNVIDDILDRLQRHGVELVGEVGALRGEPPALLPPRARRHHGRADRAGPLTDR